MTMTLNGSGTGTVGVPNSATAQNSTSGTAINFTGLPAGLKRITVMFSGVSLSGSSNILVQIGASGGVETSGYSGTVGVVDSTSPTYGAQQLSTGVQIVYYGGASNITSGVLVFALIGSNTWAFSGTGSVSAALRCGFCAGSKALSGVLDRVRITTVNGTDTFDAGSVNILYE